MRAHAVLDIIRILDFAKLRYLVVGGYAVIAHGYVRATMDLDLVPDHADETRLRRALRELATVGFVPRAPVPREAFADPVERERWITEKDMMVFSARREVDGRTDAVDLFLRSPFDFDAAWNEAHTQTVPGGMPIHFVDLERLLVMKRAADRVQDRLDIQNLLMIHGDGRRP